MVDSTSKAPETMTINLSQEMITTNTTGTQRYEVGQHTLPKDIAEDLLRRDAEARQYKENLQKGRTTVVNAGERGVGSGAE